ncbi:MULTISPECIES: helix-turn-helix domain-containing protein [unclassified Streptomyces]|uniref:helix-turn-helix domain-containing protein n=1 Tax=unclassified Streptomyces TaxID=2593676 RepID=UPI0037A1F6CA
MANGSAASIQEMLAANLKRARTLQGLSLSELSRRSGIGKATLSQLESGQGNPTIETIFSLSRVLEMPVSHLLDTQPPGELTVVRSADVEPLVGEGVDLRALHRIKSADTTVEVYDQQFRVGHRQQSRGHVGTEHTVVQSGRLQVTVDGYEIDLGPGDYVGFDASLPHSYLAAGDPVRSVLLLQYRVGQRVDRGAPHAATR